MFLLMITMIKTFKVVKVRFYRMDAKELIVLGENLIKLGETQIEMSELQTKEIDGELVKGDKERGVYLYGKMMLICRKIKELERKGLR